MNHTTWADWKKEKEPVRDDLRLAQDFIDQGFILHFDENDVLYKRNTPDKIPHHGITFIKDKLWVWGVPRMDGYQVAELIDGSFFYHRGAALNMPPHYPDRFPDTQGYIPNLETVLELDKQGTL